MGCGTRHARGSRQPLCKVAVLAFALSLPAMTASAQSSAPGLACAGLEAGPTRTVARIIDGETVVLDDGTELRLIGALVPRAIDAGADPGMWPLEVAAQEELRALILGKSVGLAFGGARATATVGCRRMPSAIEGDRRRWVQGHLLAQGLARAYAEDGNRACSGRLSRPNAWRARPVAACGRMQPIEAGRPTHPRELSRYRSTFQVVEGHIARSPRGAARST